jgi:hypothetical protein
VSESVVVVVVVVVVVLKVLMFFLEWIGTMESVAVERV